MADALGTGGGVVSDEDHRLDQAGLIAPQTSSLAVRTGVLWGPGSTALVTGTSATGTMTVNVAAHHWVTTRGTADGVYIGTKETSTTVNIAAAPGANSRIDVVYAKQNDSASTITPDGSTAELYGVVTGTAGASPSKPAIPVGAIELATVTVATGATSTNGAGVTIANTALQTVARGAPIPVRTLAERNALTTYPMLTVLRLDTGDIEIRNQGNTAWDTVQIVEDTGWQTLTITGTGFSAGADGCRYKVRNGVCHFQMHVVRDSGTRTGTILTFPSTARPVHTHWWIGAASGSPQGEIKILSTGVMSLLGSAGTSTNVVYSGSFPVT